MSNDPDQWKRLERIIEGHVKAIAFAIIVAGTVSGCLASGSSSLQDIRNELRYILQAIESRN